jgi:hypothetical protein
MRNTEITDDKMLLAEQFGLSDFQRVPAIFATYIIWSLTF